MKISTKGRYALRMMLDLALQDPNEFISIKSIATRQEVSEKYLEQIITLLNRAGYVTSARGAQGGYKLSYQPSEYTVGMILRLVEGDLSPVTCLEGETNNCPRFEHCVTVEVWQEIKDAVNAIVDGITLEDLVDRTQEKEGRGQLISMEISG